LWSERPPKKKEMVVGQCSIVIGHGWWRFAHLFLDAAPKAHPKMTNDN
jgi:hypothetical protein